VNVEKVVIIGAGPAGISAGIQLKRYNIEPVILDKEKPGGLLKNAYFIENYPGFPEGITGVNLIALFEKHLETFNITVHRETVKNIEFNDNMFSIDTDRRNILSEFVIIASGTKPKETTGIIIPETLKKRIFYEVYPLSGVTGKKIGIVGAGDAAFDYALSLSSENEVIIINRSNTIKCIPALLEKCLKTDTILYSPHTNIQAISETDNQISLLCINNLKKQKVQMVFDSLIFAIGREPALDFLSATIKKRFDELIANQLVYVVGDVKNDLYRQTALCIGDGIKAAMEIYGKMENTTDENKSKNRE